MFTDDDDIERTLRAALDVTPPAGFEGRVGERIRMTRPPRRLALPAWLGAAAAIVLAVGWWLLSTSNGGLSPVIEPARQASAPRQRPVMLAPDVPEGSPLPARGRRPDRVRSVTPSTAAVRAAPEVIVPPNQLEILRRFARGVNTGTVTMVEAPLVAPTQPVELVVPPLVVEPIPVVALESAGGGQSAKGLQ